MVRAQPRVRFHADSEDFVLSRVAGSSSYLFNNMAELGLDFILGLE
jgi:hypothetical protein